MTNAYTLQTDYHGIAVLFKDRAAAESFAQQKRLNCRVVEIADIPGWLSDLQEAGIRDVAVNPSPLDSEHLVAPLAAILFVLGLCRT